jgi:hypothetical protein
LNRQGAKDAKKNGFNFSIAGFTPIKQKKFNGAGSNRKGILVKNHNPVFDKIYPAFTWRSWRLEQVREYPALHLSWLDMKKASQSDGRAGHKDRCTGVVNHCILSPVRIKPDNFQSRCKLTMIIFNANEN